VSFIDQTQRKDVLLISMPFGALFRPAYDLSVLKASLQRRGVSARVVYFTIPFAKQTGLRPYVRIANVEPAENLIGEWVFTEELFGTTAPDYLQKILLSRDTPPSDDFIKKLEHIRSLTHSFIEDCATTVLNESPRIVTFTDSGRQRIPSLALAKSLKARMPNTFVIFVGKNCEGVMGAELVRSFPAVDAVISGETDIAYPELVRRVMNGISPCGMKGVYTKENIRSVFEAGAFPSADRVLNLDDLPHPEFDDFFEQLEQNGFDHTFKKQIHFETSRGCWWGERSHCTFCGLSDEAMPYRSKSADRALKEITDLTSKYPSCDVFLVDSILNMKFFKDFFPRLAERKLNVQLFYETKANLKRSHVRLLRESGVTMIQAGVESLDTNLLRLMGKGVSALQNIQLLKCCKEFGIKPYWNMLWGFPEECPEAYHHMAQLIPLLTHLPRPQGLGQIRLERFSPNFERADQLGLKNVRPTPAYFEIYPFSGESVRNLANHFCFDYPDCRNVDEYTRPLVRQLHTWINVHEESELFYVDKGNSLLICDLRPGAKQPLLVLSGAERTLFLACDEIVTETRLTELLQQHLGRPVSIQDVEDVLWPVVSLGLLLKENGSYLNLAIPLQSYSSYSPKASALKRCYELIETYQAEMESNSDQLTPVI
jgi:ribosomal peptide maturation radical SAM protein 1